MRELLSLMYIWNILITPELKSLYETKIKQDKILTKNLKYDIFLNNGLKK